MKLALVVLGTIILFLIGALVGFITFSQHGVVRYVAIIMCSVLSLWAYLKIRRSEVFDPEYKSTTYYPNGSKGGQFLKLAIALTFGLLVFNIYEKTIPVAYTSFLGVPGSAEYKVIDKKIVNIHRNTREYIFGDWYNCIYRAEIISTNINHMQDKLIPDEICTMNEVDWHALQIGDKILVHGKKSELGIFIERISLADNGG